MSKRKSPPAGQSPTPANRLSLNDVLVAGLKERERQSSDRESQHGPLKQPLRDAENGYVDLDVDSAEKVKTILREMVENIHMREGFVVHNYGGRRLSPDSDSFQEGREEFYNLSVEIEDFLTDWGTTYVLRVRVWSALRRVLSVFLKDDLHKAEALAAIAVVDETVGHIGFVVDKNNNNTYTFQKARDAENGYVDLDVDSAEKVKTILREMVENIHMREGFVVHNYGGRRLSPDSDSFQEGREEFYNLSVEIEDFLTDWGTTYVLRVRVWSALRRVLSVFLKDDLHKAEALAAIAVVDETVGHIGFVVDKNNNNTYTFQKARANADAAR